MNELTTKTDAILQTLVTGDIARLSDNDKLGYIQRLCESLGLNPLTRPFQLISFQGKQVVYATRDCTDQLRRVHKVSIKIAAREHINGVYVVTAQATQPDGRCDESTGAVHTDGLKGEVLANAYLKAETKAKRRVTLSICGLGLLDETEVETIKDARQVAMPEPSIRLPIKTMKDVEQEPFPSIQEAFNDIPAWEEPLPGDYVAQIGKVGGPINGKKIKDIPEQDLRGFLGWLRTTAKATYLEEPRVQSFIKYAELYITDKQQIDQEHGE